MTVIRGFRLVRARSGASHPRRELLLLKTSARRKYVRTLLFKSKAWPSRRGIAKRCAGDLSGHGVQSSCRRLAQALSIVALCGLLAPVARAAPPLPGPANPGRIDERFTPPAVPKAAPEIIVPGPKTPVPPAEAEKIHFTLTSVILDGSTVYKPADVTSLYRDLIGKEISLAQLFALRDAFTAKYRRDGYILSQVTVPPQKISGGVVHLQAVEGYVANVSIQGDTRDSRGLIAAMAERIKASRPLNQKVLERYVLLVQDLPGVSVRTVLRPAAKLPGAADLDLLLTHRTVTSYAEVDNHGSKAIGPLQALAGINLNSLFGYDEQTGFRLATVNPAHELLYAWFQHNEILTPEGVRLNLSATYSRSKPAGALADLKPLGKSVAWHVGTDYPMIRSLARTLRVGVAFTALNNRVDLLGTQFSNDKVRYLSFTANYDVVDVLFGDSRPASNLINVELSQGFNTLGATATGSSNLSRANGHSNFTRLNLEATRIQSLPDRFSLATAAAAQVAGTPLLSAQQFGLGGDHFGRGYEPSEITGDNGLAGSIEARYELSAAQAKRDRAQIYVFYDVGQVRNIDPVVGQPKKQSLASTGLGLRFSLFHRLSADIELAKPLTRDIASRGNRHIRPLFSIFGRF